MLKMTKTIGRDIAVARAVRGYDQKKLAYRAGTVPSYVSYIERGARTPSLKMLEKFAAALKLDAKQLIGCTARLDAALGTKEKR